MSLAVSVDSPNATTYAAWVARNCAGNRAFRLVPSTSSFRYPKICSAPRLKCTISCASLIVTIASAATSTILSYMPADGGRDGDPDGGAGGAGLAGGVPAPLA